jgi:transmembrane 9 superfamily member 3
LSDLPQIKELKEAIEGDYFFELFIDDLPMWGYIGEVKILRNCAT